MNSLRAKLTFTFFGLFLPIIWGLVFFTSSVIEPQMETVQKDRQFEIAKYLAADLDQIMKSRVSNLSALASEIDPTRITDRSYLQQFVQGHFRAKSEFDAGLIVIGMDGGVLADFPVVPERKENNYANRDHFIQAVSTRSHTSASRIRDWR